MTRSTIRPTFANVTAIVALFIALGGTAFAAVQANSVKSRHIVDGTVKSKDVRDENIKSKDVKDGNLKGADIGDAELDGDHLAAESIGREHLLIKCGFGRTDIDGLCYETVARGDTDSMFEASADCDRDGGRLPTALQFRAARNELELAGVHYWTDSLHFDDGRVQAVVVHKNGGVRSNQPRTAYPYVCLFEPLA